MIQNQYYRVLTVLLICRSPLTVGGSPNFAAAFDKDVHYFNILEYNQNEENQYETLNNYNTEENDVRTSEDDGIIASIIASNVRSDVKDATDDYHDLDVPAPETGNDDPEPPKADVHHVPTEMRLKCSVLENSQVIHNMGMYPRQCQFCACFNNTWLCRISDSDCPCTWCEDPLIRRFHVLFHHNCYECKCHPKINYMICEPNFAGDNWYPNSICSITAHFDPGSFIPAEKTGKLIKLFNQ